MAEKRSLIESLTSAHPHGTVPGIFRIRPVLVDTSSLVPDVVWASGHSRPSRFLASVEFGLLRPFAAHHVWAEVPRKLQDERVLRGVDPRVAAAMWFNEYVPRIPVVDVGDRIAQPHRALSERDASDTPTAALLDLIGPVVVLADDSDLIDLDLAAADWIAAVGHGYTMTVVAQYGWGALFVGRLGGFSGVELTKQIVRLARHPVGGRILACIGGLLLVTSPGWWPRVRPKVRQVGARLNGVVMDSVLPLVAEIADHYQRSEAAWGQRTRGEAGASLEQAAARILTTSPEPLSRTQMARLILPAASETEQRRLVTRLAPALESTNAFVPVDARRWQLGRAGANFGDILNGEAILDWHRPPLPPFELTAGKRYQGGSSRRVH